MIEIKSGAPENLVIAIAHGTVTGEDYDKTFVPAIEKKLKTHQKVRLFFEIAGDFVGYTADAMWNDAKLGLGHLGGFEKIAVVADESWITRAVKFFRFLSPCQVKAFSLAQLEEAKSWVAVDAPPVSGP